MTDLDRYQYVYDYNSNRLSKANVVSAASGVYLDETYGYDTLNRLTLMHRGNLSGGAITGVPSREMDYTLDPTGNWSAYQTKLNGSPDLSQTRTSNVVNEITAISSTPGWVTPLYDLAGNMTTMPQPASPTASFTTTYDAWNRMTSLTNTSNGSVTSYQYDGRDRRIVKTTPSETRHFFYSNSWQDIEERTGTATTMDKQYAWGVRYVDELVCRDDADNATTPRLYAMQDANFNLTAVCSNTSSGVLERYLFDPYGSRTIMNGSWVTISVSVYSWFVSYQGLTQDVESALFYNRMRYINSVLGTFLERDQSEYDDEMSLYAYLHSNPVSNTDPYGLAPDAQPSTRPIAAPTTKPATKPSTQPTTKPVPECDILDRLHKRCTGKVDPIDPGTNITITVDSILSAAGSAGNSCWDLKITKLKCKQQLNVTGHCDGLTTDVCSLIDDYISNANDHIQKTCARCCNKVSFNGDYTSTVTIDVKIPHPDGLNIFATCNVKGTVTISANISGTVGSCVQAAGGGGKK
jgi:RHS repeat-associated protein